VKRLNPYFPYNRRASVGSWDKTVEIVMAYSTDGLTRQLINGFDSTP